MPKTVKDVMTADPVTVNAATTVAEAAKLMRDSQIGTVLVLDDNGVRILTDRDITVRTVADGADPTTATVGDISSGAVTVSPETSTDDALRLMRQEDIRRLPVVDGTKPIGIVSLGDLSATEDAGDALADISAAPANN